MKILQGPIEVVIGVSFGIIIGILLWYIPAHDMVSGMVCAIPNVCFSDGSLFQLFVIPEVR